MHILSIETSCDETAVSVVRADGDFPHGRYTVLGNALFSQIDIHREYGGVFPALAKREHAKTLVPMLEKALTEAQMLAIVTEDLSAEHTEKLTEILIREPGLGEALMIFLATHKIPKIDMIAVTSGPGLEPALWVGINFAKALSFAWNIPLVPINHMEGHVLSSIFTETHIPDISFPALALLISGGHTELVLMKAWGSYEKIGETRDDAVGEAFDKVARMLGLQYPGGPEVSARARSAREKNTPRFVELPRPMIDSNNLDFSFSGLKTAVRYAVQNKTLSEDEVASVCREFEDSVTEVLTKKVEKAIERHRVQTLIVGGGVSANTHIREQFEKHFGETHPEVTVYFPPRKLSTDNSVMIALAGHMHAHEAQHYSDSIRITADGNLSIATV